MKLRDVEHTEDGITSKFNWNSNRFRLFDKNEINLNEWSMREVEGVLDLEVLEVKEGSYWGYGVGFPVTHIKLDYENKEHTFPHIKFGGEDTSM